MNKRRISELAAMSITEEEDHLPPESKHSRISFEPGDGGQLHPLLIDHVIENILKHLGKSSSTGKSQVLSCREVSKTWNEVGSKVFKILDTTEILFSFGDTKRLEKFLKAMSNTNCLLFQKFSFDVNFFILENGKLFCEFLRKFSPLLTHLDLCLGKNYTMIFDPLLFRDFKLSELKCLSFKGSYLNTRVRQTEGGFGTSLSTPSFPSVVEQHEGLLVLFETLLKGSTNLQTLDFCIPSKHFGEEYDPRFANLLSSHLPKSVKDFKLVMEIEEDNLRELQSLGLSLKTLHINLYGSSVSNECILEFLEGQRETLSDLNIADMECQFAERLQFPSFPVLKVLEIKGGNSSNFSFIKAFPKLEKLIFRNGRTDSPHLAQNANPVVPEIPPHLFIKDVELTYETANSTLIRRMATLFPNIQNLKIKFREESVKFLTTVFEAMPNLEELHVGFPVFFGNLPVDTIFTGIPIQQCRRMLERKSFSNLDISGVDRSPNLTHLRRLKKLEIKSESYAIVVTNVTAQFALLELSSLEELRMEQFNISGEYFEKLRKRFRLKEPEPVKKEGAELPKFFSAQFNTTSSLFSML